MKRGTRVVRQAASLCLGYPDAALIARVPMLRAALQEQRIKEFDELLQHLEGTPLQNLEREYVEVFDLSRHHALYLSYWTDGDTRRRGETLGRFKSAYRASGFLVNTAGELPDYLPMVLEFAAVADPEGVRRCCGSSARASSCCGLRCSRTVHRRPVATRG